LFCKFVFWTFDIVSDFGFCASDFSSKTGFSILHCAVVLNDREKVEGTQITIGRRVYYKNKIGNTSRRYAAEYRDLDGKQICRNLGTKSKAKARRLAIEIQQELEKGIEHIPQKSLYVGDLIDLYKEAVEIKGVAAKTLVKYNSDLTKFKEYCQEHKLKFSRRFSEYHLCQYRKWLKEGNYNNKFYADKSIEAAIVLVKQMFKWAWRQRLIKDYRLSAVSFPKAKAASQPCFTSNQVDQLIEAGVGEEKLAFALMAYAGLRIGEVEQLCWEDIRINHGRFTMIHIRRGGSNGMTKDKDERFIPVHRIISDLLEPARKNTGLIFKSVTERRLLKRLKGLCEKCGFENPRQYKLHSFRHYFASLCANNHTAYRKALAWLGHSSSEMLELYYHLNDEDSQNAMLALEKTDEIVISNSDEYSPFEGNLRAKGQSKIEKTLQVPEVQELVACLSDVTERAGFEPAVGTSPTQPFQGCSLSHSDTSPA